MFRSEAHFLMLCNLKYLELQKRLLNRFQVFKNEEIKILKKNNMKTILYEWAKVLTKENNKSINITEIPSDVLKNKKIKDILNEDIECSWLVSRIILENEKEKNENTNEKEKNKNRNEKSIPITEEELKKKDNIFFDVYPNLFYYEYPQFPYNYYLKKKMTTFYSLIKFPYNDILNISKFIKQENVKEENVKEENKGNEMEINKSTDTETNVGTNVGANDKNDSSLLNTCDKKSAEDISEDIVIDTDFMAFSSESFIYAPSEMETSKEKYF